MYVDQNTYNRWISTKNMTFLIIHLEPLITIFHDNPMSTRNIYKIYLWYSYRDMIGKKRFYDRETIAGLKYSKWFSYHQVPCIQLTWYWLALLLIQGSKVIMIKWKYFMALTWKFYWRIITFSGCQHKLQSL